MGGRRRNEGMRTTPWLLLLFLLCRGSLWAQEGTPPASRTTAQRPIVRAVRVEGNVRYSTAQIVSAFGQPLGQPLIEEPELRRGVEVLFDTFHVRATVELSAPDAASN